MDPSTEDAQDATDRDSDSFSFHFQTETPLVQFSCSSEDCEDVDVSSALDDESESSKSSSTLPPSHAQVHVLSVADVEGRRLSHVLCRGELSRRTAGSLLRHAEQLCLREAVRKRSPLHQPAKMQDQAPRSNTPRSSSGPLKCRYAEGIANVERT